MDAKPFPSLLPVVVVLGAACGAALAFALRPAAATGDVAAVVREDAAPADVPAPRTEPAPTTASAPADEASLTGNERAAEHLARVTERNRDLKAAVEDLEARIAEAEPKAVQADPRAFRFGVREQAPAFDGADWKSLSGHMLELSKVLVDIRDEVLDGGQPSAKSMQGIQKHNTPLALLAVAIAPEMGEEAHIAYTHPAVIANLIRSALVEAEDPLTRAQEVAIATLGDAWQREAARVAPPAGAPALARLVTEVEAKLRFLDDVKAVLTPSQRDALFDPATEGRIQLDLLSPAWVFAQRRPLPFPDRAAMEEGLVDTLFDLAEVEVESTAPFAWVARTWVDEVPGALEPRGRLSQGVVFPHVDELLAQARAQVRAIERVTGTGLLSAEQRAALLGFTWVLHPFRLAGASAEPSDPD